MKHDARTQAAITAGHPEWTELPATAKEARATGARHYFTGKPCKHGHVSNRYTSTGDCAACLDEQSKSPEGRARERERSMRPEVKAKARAYNQSYQKAYYQRPEVKERERAYSREYNKQPHVREKEREYQRRWRRENPPSDEEKAAFKEYMREYCQRPDVKETHRRRMRSLVAERNAQKLNATPRWLTDDHRAQIEAFYDEARRLTEATGVEHQVDHIVPLKAADPVTRERNACGLHVPWNLQVLTREENIAKLNGFDGGWGCALPASC